MMLQLGGYHGSVVQIFVVHYIFTLKYFCGLNHPRQYNLSTKVSHQHINMAEDYNIRALRVCLQLPS